ncbi:MAG: S-layer homology domain-containing protein [Actinobacteria bacterium]|nr:S-layer homology domain-containing protein [Actinomycetota bacterium]
MTLSLVLLCSAALAVASSNDRFESNDSRLAATRISPPWESSSTEYDLVISSGGDEDWFRFETVAGGLIYVTIRADSWGLGCELYGPGSSMTPIAGGMTDNIGWESLYKTAPSTGTYYLRFGQGESSSNEIRYRFKLSAPSGESPSTTTTTTSPPGSTFLDVPDSHPYAVQINDLASRGIVTGYAGDIFIPNNPVARQQFAKMIVKTLGLPVTGSEVCPFTDVEKGSGADPLYPDKYVAVCAARGITQGISATKFAPFSSITREQVITMIVRAANIPDAPEGYDPPFRTGFSWGEHYANAVKASAAGLLDGIQGMGMSYKFASPASRGEVSALLYNLLNRYAMTN